MGILPTLAYVIDWGWLRIGPPYIYININPVMFQIGPLALRWYGLMYAVAILVGLWAIRGYTERKGITQALVYRVVWWCIAAGLIGGRLYFVVQQPDFVSHYLMQPQHILATWEGGMAFFGAIFLVIPTLFWRARVERVNPLVLVDAGVLFASVGQIFGRVGNLINGDIIGYPSTLPWSTVYQFPGSWACLKPETCNVPVQPAAAYEMLTNIVLMVILFALAKRVARPGILMLVYLYGYAITQFLVFFTRANDIIPIFGIPLKQAQWTALVVFIALMPITYLVLRHSRPIPKGAVAATYGIPQKPEVEPEDENASSPDTATEAATDEEDTMAKPDTTEGEIEPITEEKPVEETTETSQVETEPEDEETSDTVVEPETEDETVVETKSEDEETSSTR